MQSGRQEQARRALQIRSMVDNILQSQQSHEHNDRDVEFFDQSQPNKRLGLLVHSSSIDGTFECTSCSVSFNSEVWQVINLGERRELAAQIASDMIHDITCPSCGTYVGTVTQPLVIIPTTIPERILLSPAHSGSPDEQLNEAIELLVPILREIQDDGISVDQQWIEENIYIVPRAYLGRNISDGQHEYTSQLVRNVTQTILRSLNDSGADPSFEKDNVKILRDFLPECASDEVIRILALSLWNSAIPTDLLPVLDIKTPRFEQYKASKLLIKVMDDETGVMGEYIVNPIIGALLEQNAIPDEVIAAHKLLSKYVQDDITDMHRRISTVPIDFGLVSHVKGEPISPDAIDFMERTMALRFIQISVEQTESLDLSKLVVGAAKKWHFHLLRSNQFHIAFNIATILFNILARWGQRDEGKELIDTTIDRWTAIDPEKELWLNLRVMHEVFGSDEAQEALQLLFPDDVEDREENEAIREYFHKESEDFLSDGIKLASSEKNAEALVSLRKAYELFVEDGDEEGMFWSQYHISETMFYLKKPVEAMEANGIARELALAVVGRPDLLAEVLQLRGKIYSASDFLNEALICLNESVAIYEKAGRYSDASESKLLKAGVYSFAGHFTHAENQVQEVLEFAKQQKHTYLERKSLNLLKGIYILSGDDTKHKLIEEALSVFEST